MMMPIQKQVVVAVFVYGAEGGKAREGRNSLISRRLDLTVHIYSTYTYVCF